MSHEHEYKRLSDISVFCPGCGDISVAQAAVCGLPHYSTYYPVYPYQPTITTRPYVTPSNPWWGTFTQTGSAKIVDTSLIQR